MTITPPSTSPFPSPPINAPNNNNNNNNDNTNDNTNDNDNNNSLSDIFSDSPPSSPSQETNLSDIPRLRSTHSTAGYRAGISASKELSLQPGFDEGYSLGAVFGLRVGYILGALEGLYCAYVDGCEERKRLRGLVREAREQLAIEKLFGKEWWGPDGLWTYEAVGVDKEVTFPEVVEWHPLVKRWAETVRVEVESAGLEIGRFEGREWEEGRV